MSKINKVYPPFFNGVSQQNPELALDSQCKEMINCVPDLVQGLKKRQPVKHIKTLDFTSNPDLANGSVFHAYDRGENSEEYIFVQTTDATTPVRAFNKAGDEMNIAYAAGVESQIKSYLATGSLRGLTVQDRTWVFSKASTVDIDYTNTAPLNESYDRVAFYWIKRGSGDKYNPFNYAVTLNGTNYEVTLVRPDTDNINPPIGAEDSEAAAENLAAQINSGTTVLFRQNVSVAKGNIGTSESVFVGTGKTGVNAPDLTRTFGDDVGLYVYSWNYNSTTGYLDYTLSFTNDAVAANDATYVLQVTASNASNFVCEQVGSMLKIYRSDSADFSFSSWDSWGNQASEGWKGSVNKITDLPKDMPFDNVYVQILGDENNTFTDYYVAWSGSSWVETLDPKANRGELTNMPVKLDRTALVGGVATFTFDVVDWSLPRVGNLDNNPDPSFVGSGVQDMFFYKNRLGIAANDSVTLTETANYTNFYASTVVDIVDTDAIDVTIATNQASKIHYAKPFNNSLYIFTKYSQYELVAEGVFSPSTVSLVNTTNYPMNINVEPVVANDSLFFVSTTDNKQQLREYIKTEKLNVKGVDLSVSIPTYLSAPITKIVVDGTLGYVLLGTSTNTVYLYNFKEDGTERVQSSWSKWTLLDGLTTTEGSWEYWNLGSLVLVINKTATDYRYHGIQLDSKEVNNKEDTSTNDITYPYEAQVVLPDYYPQITKIRTPLNKVLIKKVTIQGQGEFGAEVYRKDYNATFYKKYTLNQPVAGDFSGGLRDLDLHVASKVGNAVISIKDSSVNDFIISSIVLEGLYTASSRELR
jgi:hypothetical protein